MTQMTLGLIAADPTHRDNRQAVINAIRAAVTEHGNIISSNDWRPHLASWIYPKVIGATVNALIASGVLTPHGWTTSDDVKGGNAGRPARRYAVDVARLERAS